MENPIRPLRIGQSIAERRSPRLSNGKHFIHCHGGSVVDEGPWIRLNSWPVDVLWIISATGCLATCLRPSDLHGLVADVHLNKLDWHAKIPSAIERHFHCRTRNGSRMKVTCSKFLRYEVVVVGSGLVRWKLASALWAMPGVIQLATSPCLFQRLFTSI